MLAVISKLCKPSDYWFGKFSTETQIKNGKLWLSQHLNSVKIHFGIVPSKWEIDSCIRWIEASRGSHIVKYVKDEQDKFILEFIDYLNEIGIIYDKSAKKMTTNAEPSSQIFPSIRSNLIETKFDDFFYSNLAKEVNLAYKFGMFTSAIILSRKMIENLVIEIFRAKYKGFKPRNLNLFYGKKKRRFHDFSYLIDKLEINNKKNDFGPNKHDISKFLSVVKPFRNNANSNTHSIIQKPKQDDVTDLDIQYMVGLLAKVWKDLS
ncbi:MAG: hypothetical protein WAQ29_09795 [Nitrososphaeraceae archaeon]